MAVKKEDDGISSKFIPGSQKRWEGRKRGEGGHEGTGKHCRDTRVSPVGLYSNRARGCFLGMTSHSLKPTWQDNRYGPKAMACRGEAWGKL